MTDPRALHDAMAKDPRVPILRSTAPDSRTFGTTQTVRRGEPLVPPRDYHKGTQVPRSADYDVDTVGTIYDVAYQGVADGEIRFEVRGYSGDDMVHPGSGQTESVPLGAKTIAIRDLFIAIVKATSDAVTYPRGGKDAVAGRRTVHGAGMRCGACYGRRRSADLRANAPRMIRHYCRSRRRSQNGRFRSLMSKASGQKAAFPKPKIEAGQMAEVGKRRRGVESPNMGQA